MNIKKAVVESIKNKLSEEQRKLRNRCETNKLLMKDIASNQEQMKREIAKLGQMIKDLEG